MYVDILYNLLSFAIVICASYLNMILLPEAHLMCTSDVGAVTQHGVSIHTHTHALTHALTHRERENSGKHASLSSL